MHTGSVDGNLQMNGLQITDRARARSQRGATPYTSLGRPRRHYWRVHLDGWRRLRLCNALQQLVQGLVVLGCNQGFASHCIYRGIVQ